MRRFATKANRWLIVCLAAAALATPAGTADAALLTADAYDPPSANDVDTEDSNNDVSLADFRTLVGDAYANDLGGAGVLAGRRGRAHRS